MKVSGCTPKTTPLSYSAPIHFQALPKFDFSTGVSPSSKVRFRAVRSSSGNRWKLNDINPDVVHERLSSWLLKTQNFLNEVTAPLVKTGQGRKPEHEKAIDNSDVEEIFMVEQTIHGTTPRGNLSLAAVVSIEQFSRLNGLTGRKMQKIFEALSPEFVRIDARNLVEYCCFRYLSRDSSDIHPSLKEPAFQRLIFITMLAWEHPYCTDDDFTEHSSVQNKLVGEAAFCRFASAVSGVADKSTVHNLFKALVGEEDGLSLGLWTTYVTELLKVHQGRKSYQSLESARFQYEQILCVGSSRKRPVLKWENNMAWPGRLTLTDKALYFEAATLTGHKEPVRLDLTRQGSQVVKSRVGPTGFVFFDSAVSVSSGPESKPWVLEFVDFSGEMRRDMWHSFISEIISVYDFIREYGSHDDDPSLLYVYGAGKGKQRALTSAKNSIARLQALQYIQKMPEDPSKLVQFLYLRNVPYGDIVCQTLAVNFWGGPLIKKVDYQSNKEDGSFEGHSGHVFDIDGCVYLNKWMRSPTWASNTSISFWKNSTVKQGVVLGKNLVVADLCPLERAALTCREKSQILENTQATIDAAMIKGIPSNIDLFKELMLPFVVMAQNFEKLRCWQEPHLTISFLIFAYTIIFRNLLSYLFPMFLFSAATAMLLLKGLKEQGRLGRFFGRVTIRDQPQSNTIEKIIALRQAMEDFENFLQNLNVSLLKVRTIILSGHPQITGEVALVLLCSAITLLVVPFRYILAFLLLDLFTRELEFRREMVLKFRSLLRERWAAVPAAPVVVLPFDSTNVEPGNPTKENNEKPQ